MAANRTEVSWLGREIQKRARRRRLCARAWIDSADRASDRPAEYREAHRHTNESRGLTFKKDTEGGSSGPRSTFAWLDLAELRKDKSTAVLREVIEIFRLGLAVAKGALVDPVEDHYVEPMTVCGEP